MSRDRGAAYIGMHACDLGVRRLDGSRELFGRSGVAHMGVANVERTVLCSALFENLDAARDRAFRAAGLVEEYHASRLVDRQQGAHIEHAHLVGRLLREPAAAHKRVERFGDQQDFGVRTRLAHEAFKLVDIVDPRIAQTACLIDRDAERRSRQPRVDHAHIDRSLRRRESTPTAPYPKASNRYACKAPHRNRVRPNRRKARRMRRAKAARWWAGRSPRFQASRRIRRTKAPPDREATCRRSRCSGGPWTRRARRNRRKASRTSSR